jgi:hypothetical protein
MSEILALHSGKILENVHDAGTCLGDHCCVHSPSDHPLNTAPLDWWWEFRHMVRVCEHGVSHPDPDDLMFKQIIGDWLTVEAISSVHLMKENCDGCCVTARSSSANR